MVYMFARLEGKCFNWWDGLCRVIRFKPKWKTIWQEVFPFNTALLLDIRCVVWMETCGIFDYLPIYFY